MESSIFDRDCACAEKLLPAISSPSSQYCCPDVRFHRTLMHTMNIGKSCIKVRLSLVLYSVSGSTKKAMMTVASKAKPSRIPLSSWTNSTAGVSIMEPLSLLPVMFVRFTLLQKLAPQNSNLSSL